LIDRQEVMDFSKEFGVTANVVEKDYVIGWILAGISNHVELSSDWLFKGGTCLKKCFFETYRFSEDLDFTITNYKYIDQNFLNHTFRDIAVWVYNKTGIEIPQDNIRFDIYENPRGNLSAQGRVSYRGPMQPRGDLPRLKLDIMADEVVVLDSASPEVHHPYSDRPEERIHIRSYCFEELFAEKIRALGERLRPRDLYDVVYLYRHDNIRSDRVLVLSTLKKKCESKKIPIPTIEILENKTERTELESEWENMLAHQLPVLPPFEQLWQELEMVFGWLYQTVEKVTLSPIPLMGKVVDETWEPPFMSQAWHTTIPLEVIRFAAANRLCIDLAYQGTHRLIEPYSLRRTRTGNLLLYAVKHTTGEDRSYRIDRIQGAEVTKVPFTPRYVVDLTASGPISAPPTTHRSSKFDSLRSRNTKSSRRQSKSISSHLGPKYVVECGYCGKRFIRKTNNTKLNPHKDKHGYPCPGRSGYMVDIKF